MKTLNNRLKLCTIYMYHNFCQCTFCWQARNNANITQFTQPDVPKMQSLNLLISPKCQCNIAFYAFVVFDLLLLTLKIISWFYISICCSITNCSNFNFFNKTYLNFGDLTTYVIYTWPYWQSGLISFKPFIPTNSVASMHMSATDSRFSTAH